MLSAFGMAFKTPELRKKIFFTLSIMALFRFGSVVPTPGVSYTNVQQCLAGADQGGLFGLINLFSGGALIQLSVFALGIMPYITASIIVQLLTVVIPRFETLKKEGQSGTAKLTQYTRYLTIALGILQSTTLITVARSGALFGNSSEPACAQLLTNEAWYAILLMVITMTAGTGLIMWMAELVTERGIGNGISMIIFSGIVAGLPAALGGTLELVRTGEMNALAVLAIFAMVIAVTAFVVFVERGQRRITVNYARRQQGRKLMQAQSTHLPLKINMAGVIPPIFASSIILFPGTLGQWLGSNENMRWIADITSKLSPGEPIYVILYASAIVFFCFFYTALVFNARETADNLKRSGAFIPGIRPGEQTARYIDTVMTRLTAVGAIYITAVCLLPEFLIVGYNVPFYFGGTSLLIVVVVVMDFMAQVQAHLMSHQYEGLMKKANLKAPGAGLLR